MELIDVAASEEMLYWGGRRSSGEGSVHADVLKGDDWGLSWEDIYFEDLGGSEGLGFHDDAEGGWTSW